jgi:starch synthase
MVASEATPWAKTGGLADVVAALPEALVALGHRVTVVLPRYRAIAPANAQVSGGVVALGSARHLVQWWDVMARPDLHFVFVDEPALFDRPELYGAGGEDYRDNDRRFGLLSTAALAFADPARATPRVDVVHAHDWQGSLALAMLAARPDAWPALSTAGRVLTIHNLAYQGVFPRESVPALGLPWSLFTMETGEFWGRFGFLKAGISSADYVTTVSPKYAVETLTADFGCGLEGALSAKGPRYLGILNGIDTDVWNPAADPHLPASYSATDLSGKRQCKRALFSHFGLPVGDDALDRPAIGIVSRLVDQKGIDLVMAAGESLVALDATWCIVGSGESRYEAYFRSLAARFPARVGCHVGFDERLAHLVEAGADMFLMPSRFEPCGLNQMYSLRYGTVPIVRAVGGLDDTVQPYTARARHAQGFKFADPTPEALLRTVRQAVRLFADRAVWARLVQNGMRADHSWQPAAREYVKVYRRARLEGADRDQP